MDGSQPWQALPTRDRSCMEPLTPIILLGSLLFISAQAGDAALGVRGELRLLVSGEGLGSPGTSGYITEVLQSSTKPYFSFLQQTPFPSSHRCNVQSLLCYENLFGIYPIGLTLQTTGASPGPAGAGSPAATFCLAEILSLCWQERDGNGGDPEPQPPVIPTSNQGF